jgi:hypothetical protein
MLPRLATSLGLAALVLGCATQRTEIRGTGDNNGLLTLAAVTRDCGVKNDLHQQSIERYQGFALATVEFRDDGHSAGYDQVEQVRGLLDEVDKENGPGALIVVFVHGWHHNADPFDDNMRCFRNVIGRVHSLRHDRHDPRPMVGIVVAWRGDNIKEPLINWATFWNRKAASETIGKLGARDFLVELADRHQRDRQAGRKTSVIFVGHSFGADLIFSALEYRLLGGAGNRVQVVPPLTPGSAVKAERKGFGELAILVNPAVEASRYRPFDADLDAPGEYQPTQNPRLVVVASHADWAVRDVFPVGQSLWMFFHPAYWGCGTPCLLGLGHFQSQITHMLHGIGTQPAVQDGGGKCGCRALDPSAGFQRTAFDVDGVKQQTVGKGITLTPVPGKAKQHSPFLVIETNKSVIREHSDIFNSRIMDFIVNYIYNLPDLPNIPRHS